MIASATEYDVITQVPWLELMPSAPEMVGTETLAIVMSSTAMKFAVARTIAAAQSIPPFRGWFMSVRLGVDGDHHRQADLQRVRGKLALVERNAHRHALHHLDPVAGGVLRRDGREGRAGAAGKAGDHAAVAHLAAIEVGGHFRRLADTHMVELSFLEVGIHVHLHER